MDTEDSQAIGTHENPVVCRWQDCRLQFGSIADLVNHLSKDHISRKQMVYYCEWFGCPRYRMQQNSRFSLISHLRCHTGEKPYTCEHCQKAFPRSDALAKHIKSKHASASDEEKLHEKSRSRHEDASVDSGELAKTLEKRQGIHSFIKCEQSPGVIYFMGHPLSHNDKRVLAIHHVMTNKKRDLSLQLEVLQARAQNLERVVAQLRKNIWG